MSRFKEQLRVLLYKNFLLKKRNKEGTILEILGVLYILGILAFIKIVSQDTKPAIPQANTTLVNLNRHFPSNGFGYAFISKDQNAVLQKVVMAIEKASNMSAYKFESEEKLDEFYQNNADNFTVGLTFEYYNASSFSYTVKVDHSKMTKIGNGASKTSNEDTCRGNVLSDRNCPAAKYITSQFALIQALVDLKFIEVTTNQQSSFPLSSSIKMFPKPEYTPFNEQFNYVIGICILIAFTPYISFLLTNIVKEKKSNIKESMKIMGLNMLAYWLSWFITYAIIVFISFLIATAILYAVFGDSSFFIIFFVFLLYGFSIISLSFMLTPLFTNARTAVSFASGGTILVGAIGLIHNYLNTSIAVKWMTGFLSPVALLLSLQPGQDYRSALTWDNVSSKGDFPASNGIIMLLLDTILYLLLAIYLDLIFPGEYGKAKHPLFLFSPAFWKNTFVSKKPAANRQYSLLRPMSNPDNNSDNENDTVNEDIEAVPKELIGGKVISIRNLYKHFKQGKKKPDIKALRSITFDVYEGQITALLGHNGSGKSTLISILTGMLMPSGGSAEMYGFNIRNPEDLNNVREHIGLCPQHNIFFEQLTPRENLYIYAGIKAIPKSESADMVEKLLKEIDLDCQKNTIAKDLSRGQKRKLCIGIALIGNPKIVFLDEPTNGMDPSSRRHIWSLLQNKRKGRVLFLTTHFMDEADILADHKAILLNGRIRCAGSSLFLKSRFGIGYHLGMVIEENTNVSVITDLVKRCITGSELSRHHGKELAYRLPLSQVSNFPDLFRALEEANDNMECFTAPKLGVTSYGVSMTTLEEVFLRLGGEEDEEDETSEGGEKGIDRETKNGIGNKTLMGDDSHLTVNDSLAHAHQTNLHNASLDLHPAEFSAQSTKRKVTMWIQLMALLEVQWLIMIRNPLRIVSKEIIPLILVIIGLVFMKDMSDNSKASEESSLKVALDMYSPQKEILWKLNNKYSTKESLIEDGFRRASSANVKVDELKLMKQAPHVVACDIQTVSQVGDLGYTLYWNSSQVHSIPAGINALSNVMYRVITENQSSVASTPLPITTYNKPFKARQPEWTYNASDFQLQIVVMFFGLFAAAMAVGFSMDVVAFRELGVRHQLRVSGTNRLVYWLMFVVGDLLVYIPLIIVLSIMIPALDIKVFNNSVALGATFLILIMYILSSLFFAITISFIFKKWESALSAILIVNIMMAIIPFIAITIVDMTSGSIYDKPLHATLARIVCVFDPPSTLLAGLYYIMRVYRVETIVTGNTDPVIPASKYFGWQDENNALPAIYLIMLFHIVFYMFLTYAIDCYKAGGFVVLPFSLLAKFKRNSSAKAKRIARQPTRRESPHENDDVIKEREDVTRFLLEDRVSETGVVVQGLKKSFGEKKVVRDITFKVQKGEILGLLGPNGAGKTTSLNMVTTEILPDKGEVYIDGYNINSEPEKAFHNFGYCPQFHSLWPKVTIREHLKCYGLIKGIPRDKLTELINHYAETLKICEHMDKYSKVLSGGTRHKLSFLISIIGNAGIVVLDEPSNGMDPGARRCLWTLISANIKENCCAILTTHSMEEADALCTRVGILVNGQLKCIGTTQQLKSNYGGGYQLEIKFKMDDGVDASQRKQKLSDYVHEMFPDVQKLEYFGSRITYKVPYDNVKNLSSVFSQLEAGKEKVAIEEYNFSQSSLEQVFLEFAKEQDDDATGRTERSDNRGNNNVTV